jgi:hypothetical protein
MRGAYDKEDGIANERKNKKNTCLRAFATNANENSEITKNKQLFTEAVSGTAGAIGYTAGAIGYTAGAIGRTTGANHQSAMSIRTNPERIDLSVVR